MKMKDKEIKDMAGLLGTILGLTFRFAIKLGVLWVGLWILMKLDLLPFITVTVGS
jgi:hypothetical protein